MKKIVLFIVLLVLAFSVVPSFAEKTLSDEDIELIAAKVVELMNFNLDEFKQSVKKEVLEELSQGSAPQSQPAAAPVVQLEPTAIPSPTPTATPKETYVGAHVKQVNSYAYVNGGDQSGAHTYRSQYFPNELFTLDVVFENDGNMALPANLELRHSGGVGEYTCHRESAFSNRELGIKPGERVGFSFACHGSENIGTISFYFTLYDDSGKPIPGGFGYFTYIAAP